MEHINSTLFETIIRILRSFNESKKAEDRMIVASTLKEMIGIGELILEKPYLLDETQKKKTTEILGKLKTRLREYKVFVF